MMKYQTLPWIAGNQLALRIPLQKVTITADGHYTEDYEPQDGDVVTIILRSQRSEKTYVPEIEGNIATISDNGTLLIGEYAVETLVVESDGTKRRSYYPFVLNVMKATPDMLAYFDDFPEYADGILLDTPSIFFAVGSGGGTVDAYTKAESDARYVKKVDMAAYSTTQQMNAAIEAALNGYATLQDIQTLQDAINGKQDTISDLASIREGAALGATAYQKSSTGIPSTDLSSAVQTSLEKADNAVPSTRTVNGKALSSNISLDASDVGALPSDTPLFSGDYNDLSNKPTIPDVSNKEDVTPIVALSTAVSTLTAEVGKYYRFDVAVETLAITLPTMTGVTNVKTITFYMTGGTTPGVTFTSTHNVYLADFTITSGKTYEVNAAWNGASWIVAAVNIVISNSNSNS